jgi:hypothetical protein
MAEALTALQELLTCMRGCCSCTAPAVHPRCTTLLLQHPPSNHRCFRMNRKRLQRVATAADAPNSRSAL